MAPRLSRQAGQVSVVVSTGARAMQSATSLAFTMLVLVGCDDIQPLPDFDGAPGSVDASTGPDARPSACATSLSVGGATACVVIEGGTIQCWGEGTNGQLGDGETMDRSEVVTVSDVSDAQLVGTAGISTCARRDAGLFCWGDNAYGQMADLGESGDQATPFEVDNAGLVVDGLDGGWVFACILADGEAICWGWNGLGELGNGATADEAGEPAAVMGVADATSIELGSSHGCVTSGADADVVCWGENADGQAGGTPGAARTSAATVAGVTDVAQLAIGQHHSCVRTTGGDVWCWGADSFGQLGSNGTGEDSGTPVAVPLPAPATWVGAGFYHTCAVTSLGLHCWGRNTHGQIGLGVVNESKDVSHVPGLDDAVEVEGGTYHTCARTSDGNVYCWGNNVRGSLADGSFDDRSSPFRVPLDCD